MDRRVYFIEAKSPGAHVFSAYALPRLGTILLATILRQKGYETRVFIEDIAKPDWKAFRDVEVVGISTITSTANRAYRMADRLRSEGKTVIMGGPHPTFLPDEALEHCDYVIRGEGEESIVELLEHIEGKRPAEGIGGLSYKTPTGNAHNPSREFIKDLTEHPAPDFSLVHEWKAKNGVIPIATSRGCPFDCKFCSVIHMFGRKYRFKPIDRIIQEIKEVWFKGAFIFFVDDNFTADKNRTKELLKRIISDGLKIQWSAQVRSDAAKDRELLRLMKKSGCTNVYIGFESVNQKTLELMNKKQGLEDMKSAIAGFKDFGIRIHGMFVLGMDTDDEETIKDTQRFARQMDLETVQFLILTPLPGTPVYEELKAQGRILHTDWSKYDALHAVFSPAQMTPAQLQRGVFKAMARFYSWSRFIKHVASFNFYCGGLTLYGKMAVRKARQQSELYLKEALENIPKFGLKN